MTRCAYHLRTLMPLICRRLTRLGEGLRFLRLSLRSSPALAAEHFLLRKHWAFSQERHVKPRRATTATRVGWSWLASWCDGRHALVLGQPATFIRWHRQGVQLFWRWKSRPGRPRIPAELPALIRQMTHENPTWGQERIANERGRKLGWRVSPRPVRKYRPKCLERGPGKGATSQGWFTCVGNHVQALVACDFWVAVTATFRIF